MGKVTAPDEAGWFIVESDPEGRQALAHWERFSTKLSCEDAIRRYRIPAAGLLTARLWDGEKWI